MHARRDDWPARRDADVLPPIARHSTRCRPAIPDLCVCQRHRAEIENGKPAGGIGDAHRTLTELPLDTCMSTTIAKPMSTGRKFDIERVRADFPILHQQVNGKPLVYLDNAA